MRGIGPLVLALAVAGCSVERSSDEFKTEEQVIRWKMTSAVPSSMVLFGTAAKRFEREIARVSNGNIEIKFHEPGALAPALEGFDAVSYGAIEAGYGTPGYWAGKVPALQIFAAVPFGPAAPEYMAWFYNGGGKEIFDELYHRHNIHSIMCGIISPEASGWFNREINTPEDMAGLKIRYFGLGGKVLEKLGASTQLLAGGEIFLALELGTIDAAEFSAPATDLSMGFHQVAKHYYLPGWHQQSTFQEVMINLDAWNSISDTQRALIEMTCGDNIRHTIAEGEAQQAAALKTYVEEGVTIHTWNDEMLAAFEAAWIEVAAEFSAEDEDFRRAWESLVAFREEYKTWYDVGYLKRK